MKPYMKKPYMKMQCIKMQCIKMQFMNREHMLKQYLMKQYVTRRYDVKSNASNSLYFLQRRVVVCITVLLLGFTSVFAQFDMGGMELDSMRTRFGAGVHLLGTFNRASFGGLPQAPTCCSEFTSVLGVTASASVLFETPLSRNMLFTSRISYLPGSAPFKEVEMVDVIDGQQLTNGSMEHTLNSTWNMMALQGGISYRSSKWLFLDAAVRLGARFGSTYSMSEKLSAETPGTFLNDDGSNSFSRTRNVSSGSVQDLQVLDIAVVAGVHTEFPMNFEKSILFCPEIDYAFSATPMISGVSWSADNIRFGASIKWQVPVREIRVPDTMLTPPPMLQPTPQLVAVPVQPMLMLIPTIRFTAVDNGVESPVERIRFEEFQSEQITSLLPYVFFEKGRADIPERYSTVDATSTTQFNEKNLFGLGTLDVYHQILNILGQRMQTFSDASIVLTGCIMPDAETEIEGGTLAANRADAVKEYLTDVWHINASRISIVERGLPESKSNPASTDGQEENRRVEIATSNSKMLDLVQVADTIRTTTVPFLRTKTHVAADTSIAHWYFSIAMNGNSVYTNSGLGDPPGVIDWNIEQNLRRIPRAGDTLVASLSLTDAIGTLRTDHRQIFVNHLTIAKKRENRVGDKRIDEYGLVLFAFGKSDMGEANERIFRLIKSRCTAASKAIVTGHTDRTGSEEGNLKLSQKRADAIGQTLKPYTVSATGYGEQDMPYSNDLPEGRYYNRTVRVRVETPITP